MMQDFKAMIAMAKRPARTVELCLRGDLVADLEEEGRKLAAAREFKDLVAIELITAKMLDLKAQMADAVIVVKFEAMKRDEWLNMLAGHPPRDMEPDQSLGFNTQTMYPDMIRASWVEPDIDPEDKEQLLYALNDGQFSELAEAAFSVNTRGAVVPFGWRDYRPMQS